MNKNLEGVLSERDQKYFLHRYAQNYRGIDCFFDASVFQSIVNSIRRNEIAQYEIGEKCFMVRPLPDGVKIVDFYENFVDLTSKHGKAPRMKRGNIYCVSHPETGRLVLLKIKDTLGEGSQYKRRRASWEYMRVRVRAGSGRLS